ncbi:hypothetical protein E1301_Tti003210 [Triplophysa tibetana]|uniref:Uncharacterized protein n=1 Tax=Triplophysa tibetana TaxID=1572043 RepID=A0A5A9PPD1_9TELE|nr:hypothetical protein E1301_Tti003210 [Triplophysa tibetana]
MPWKFSTPAVECVNKWLAREASDLAKLQRVSGGLEPIWRSSQAGRDISEPICKSLTLDRLKIPFRRVTFSVVSQPQDPHQGSLQSCYDSGLEESETPSSKSSSGPRLGALPLPEDAYERTTPDGSVARVNWWHLEKVHLKALTVSPSPPLGMSCDLSQPSLQH